MSVDILGTSCDQCRSTVQYSFTSTETRMLARTDSPGRPPQLSHSSWTMLVKKKPVCLYMGSGKEKNADAWTKVEETRQCALRLKLLMLRIQFLCSTIKPFWSFQNETDFYWCCNCQGWIHQLYLYCFGLLVVEENKCKKNTQKGAGKGGREKSWQHEDTLLKASPWSLWKYMKAQWSVQIAKIHVSLL